MADKKVRFINLNNQILTLGGDGILSFSDIATMASEPISGITDGTMAWVDSEQKYYQFLASNETIESGKWRELEMGGTADKVKYENADYPDLINVGIALDNIIAKIYYVNPSITSFTMSPSTTEYEIGTVVNGLTFTWTVNKEITSQTLTDCTIAIDDRTATYSNPLSETKTFSLVISDGENSTTASKKISFLNKVYWGSVVEPFEYNSDFVLGLENSNLTSGKSGNYTMTIGSGEYGYFAMPTSFGTLSSVNIGGFDTDIETCSTISFTNASGNTSSYTIYRLGRTGLGNITMRI